MPPFFFYMVCLIFQDDQLSQTCPGRTVDKKGKQLFTVMNRRKVYQMYDKWREVQRVLKIGTSWVMEVVGVVEGVQSALAHSPSSVGKPHIVRSAPRVHPTLSKWSSSYHFQMQLHLLDRWFSRPNNSTATTLSTVPKQLDQQTNLLTNKQTTMQKMKKKKQQQEQCKHLGQRPSCWKMSW